MKKLNWFERRTLEILLPYEYNDNLNTTNNAKVEYLQKSISMFDLLIMPIGLISLRLKAKRG